jgi:hypothetical protein
MLRGVIITVVILLWWAHVWIPALISTRFVFGNLNLGNQLEQFVNATLHWHKETLDPFALSIVVKESIALSKVSGVLEVRNPGRRDILHLASASNTTYLNPASVRVPANHSVNRLRAQWRSNEFHRVAHQAP